MLASFFERETLREKNLEKANREMKIRARKEAASKKEDLDAGNAQEQDDTCAELEAQLANTLADAS